MYYILGTLTWFSSRHSPCPRFNLCSIAIIKLIAAVIVTTCTQTVWYETPPFPSGHGTASNEMLPMYILCVRVQEIKWKMINHPLWLFVIYGLISNITYVSNSNIVAVFLWIKKITWISYEQRKNVWKGDIYNICKITVIYTILQNRIFRYLEMIQIFSRALRRPLPFQVFSSDRIVPHA